MARSARKDQGKEININLMPQQEIKGTLGATISWVLGVGRYLIIATEIIALVIFGLSLKLTVDKNNLNATIKNNQNHIDSKASFEQEFRDLQNKLVNIEQLRSDHFNQYEAIKEFNSLLPQGIDLTSLDIAESEISFSGSFPTAAQLQTMINSFNRSGKIVGLDITSLKSPSSQDPKFTFEAKAQIFNSAFAEAEDSATESQEVTSQ